MIRQEKNSEWSTLSENNWFSLAVASVIIGLVLFGFVAAWVLTASNLIYAKQRIDVAVPFATVYLALVTFCTVAWRGLVGARQADQQKAQNDANDDANYAKLLQEGAKLLGDHSKQHDLLAGITTLEVVVHEPQKRFSSQAVDMIANFYSLIHRDISQEAASNYNANAVAGYSRLAVSKASSAGFKNSIRAKFSAQTEDMFWHGISGFLHQSYEGGTLRGDQLNKIANDRFSIKKAVVQSINYPFSSGSFDDCIFKFCTVKEIDEFTILFDGHKFKNCNFSGCDFKSDPLELDETIKLLENENWYDVENPPFHERPFDWAQILVPKKKATSGTFVTLRGNDIPF